MDIEAIRALFEKKVDEVELSAFDKVQNKRSKKSDLHAFILLDSICPDKLSIISGAEHEMIRLNVSLSNLSNAGITEEQITELVGCGVFVGEDSDYLFMFV